MRLWRVSMAATLVLAAASAGAQDPKTGAAKTPPAAAGKACKLEISGNDLIQFDKKELRVGADCATVELTLRHVGKLPVQAMGHNWVLSRTADADAVAKAGLAAGLKNQHVAPDDKRVIAHTKLIGGGQTDSVSFSAKVLQKGGDYTYQCTFPGHSAIMRGKLIVG